VSKTFLMSLASAFAVVAIVTAQDEGGGGGGGGGALGGEGGGGVRALTKFEQFTNRLKLDKATQVPLVSPILQEAATAGATVGQEMTTLQTQLANALLANKTDAEIKPILDAYTAAAATMTGIETKAFGKIYAMLKPNQQSNAAPAFDMMAGWFQPPPAAAGRGGARAGGRGGPQ
jgi:hypothetical protein